MVCFPTEKLSDKKPNHQELQQHHTIGQDGKEIILTFFFRKINNYSRYYCRNFQCPTYCAFFLKMHQYGQCQQSRNGYPFGKNGTKFNRKSKRTSQGIFLFIPDIEKQGQGKNEQDPAQDKQLLVE